VQDRELVAAEPRDGVAVRDGIAQPRTDPLQQLVADRMPE